MFANVATFSKKMRKKEHIVRITADEAGKLLAAGGDKTDWQRVKALSQEDVERLADEDDGPLPEGWEDSISFGSPEPKKDVHIRLDAAVIFQEIRTGLIRLQSVI